MEHILLSSLRVKFVLYSIQSIKLLFKIIIDIDFQPNDLFDCHLHQYNYK